MYKCKECGAEYKEKPDYCDCGNDEFEGVNEGVNIGVNAKEKSDNAGQVLPDKNLEQVKPIPASSMKNSGDKTISKKQTIYSESYPEFSRLIKSLDPMSLIIFFLCIVLSFYVVFFAWNPKGVNKWVNREVNGGVNREVKETKQEFNQTKSIPSIDKFWNNSLPVIKAEPQKKEEPKLVEPIVKVIKQTEKPITKKQPVQTVKPKVTVVPLKKVTPAKTTAVQTKTNTQVQAPKQQDNTAQKKAEEERKKAEAEQLKKLQAEQAKKQAEAKAKQAQISKQELTAYKAQLRNTIGRKIDFTRVIGDGSCTVSFKIDSNGKLTNRTFSKQSSNNTLNDEVYKAVMATPTFSPPPSAYNKETLNLNIRFSNGNFEISLP